MVLVSTERGCLSAGGSHTSVSRYIFRYMYCIWFAHLIQTTNFHLGVGRAGGCCANVALDWSVIRGACSITSMPVLRAARQARSVMPPLAPQDHRDYITRLFQVTRGYVCLPLMYVNSYLLTSVHHTPICAGINTGYLH